ncbi:GNAT family N-acetyltransferase [Actinomadura scrupuli]|uniref:GNAT family N-acetyltransferase n=1 Tax=Actinomadura scrupuli TaxID=559629 RepID=UPI003D953CA2
MPDRRPRVRPVEDRDLPQVAGIAAANGERGPSSAAGAGYVGHLRRHGAFLVAELDGAVAGYCATRPVGAATMLCDLFIDPARQGAGVGRTLLDRALDGLAEIFTFSSRDPRAMPLYVRYGLVPRWPLLYLEGPPPAPGPPGLRARTVPAGRAAGTERALTGADRDPDHAFWATMPGAAALVVERDGEPVAAGAGEVTPGSGALLHLAVAAGADAAQATAAALTGLGSARLQACLPGPHPALRGLLAAGWRIGEHDHHMSTRDGLVDPRQVLSPALA